MILEEGKIRAFQSVSLKMFDMPHQPRRMRQAVRIWRTWQAQTNLKARLKDIRGDGLSVLHKTEEDLRRGDFGARIGDYIPAREREAVRSHDGRVARVRGVSRDV